MTGTGTQTNPYVPTTWAEFVTAIGSFNAYVSVPENTVWDISELYPNGINSSITWSCYEVQGNGLKIKNLKFTGSNSGFAYPVSSSFIRRSTYDILFTDLQLENDSHFILQPSHNDVWFNFDFYDCEFQGSVQDSVFDLCMYTTSRTTGYTRCLFDLQFSGNSTMFLNASSDNRYTHAVLYGCKFMISGKMPRSSNTKIHVNSCLIQGEWATTGIYFGTSNDDGSKYAKDTIINATIPAGYSVTTLNPDCIDHVLVNSDKVESGATIHSAFTRVTDSQLKNADYLASIGFPIATASTPEPYDDDLWRITKGVNDGYPYNMLLPGIIDLPTEVRLRLGGLKFKKTTQAAYDKMTEYDPDTVYILVGSNNIWNESVDNKYGARQIKGIYCGDELVWSTYRQVEYIQSTGTQYILTDIIPTYDMSVQVDMKLGTNAQRTSDPYYYVFGLGGTDNGVMSVVVHWAWNQSGINTDDVIFFHGWRRGASGNSISEVVVTSRNILTLARPQSSLGTTTCNINYINEEPAPSIPMAIFGVNYRQGVGAYNHRDMYVYSFKMYDKNVLIHDLIPVERQADGELGLYDTITDKFYSNSGTGTFLKGDYI